MAYRADCDVCGNFIGNFAEEEDAKNAVTMHKAIHARNGASKLPPPDPNAPKGPRKNH